MGASCSIDGLPEDAVDLAKSHVEGLKAKGVTTDEFLAPPMSAYIEALRIAHKPGVTPIQTAAAFSKAFKADREAQSAAATAAAATAAAAAAAAAAAPTDPTEGAAMATEANESTHKKEVDSHIGMVTNQANHQFLVAVDGHESSSKPAFEACLKLMKNRDQLRLMHCYDPEEQESLPLNEKGTAPQQPHICFYDCCGPCLCITKSICLHTPLLAQQ